MAALPLAECEKVLHDPPISEKALSNILDSLTIHIQCDDNAAEQVARIIQDIKEPIHSLFQRVDTLEKEMEEMKRKWESLKTLEDSLLMGQLAFTLERELVEKFLEGTGISPKHVTIEQIFIALGKETDYMLPLTPEQKDIINASWKELERKYQLDHTLYRTITALKRNRNFEAHPRIENISTRLSDKVSPSDKEDVKKMLEILKKIQKKM